MKRRINKWQTDRHTRLVGTGRSHVINHIVSGIKRTEKLARVKTNIFSTVRGSDHSGVLSITSAISASSAFEIIFWVSRIEKGRANKPGLSNNNLSDA
jgi:hypothetical protein